MALTTWSLHTGTQAAFYELVVPLVRVFADENQLDNVDPYLAWHGLLDYETVAPAARDVEGGYRYFSVLIELHRPGALPDLQQVRWVRSGVSEEALRFVTAQVRVPEGPSPKLEDLLPAGSVAGVIICAASTPASGSGDDSIGQPLSQAPVDLSLRFSLSGIAPGDGRKRTQRVLIGIIDDGFGIANRRLHGGGHLRSMWHQGLPDESPRATDAAGQPRYARRSSAPSWRDFWIARPFDAGPAFGAMPRPSIGPSAPYPTMRFGYGFELDLHRRDQLLRELRSPARGELDLLHAANYLQASPRWTHGSAMADLILHSEYRYRQRRDCRQRLADRPRQLGRPRPRGAHQHVLVQLPRSTVRDTSGASLAAYAYDAILFVMDQAHDGEQVVVNLSYGSFGGPHDESSMFERAVHDLLERFGGVDEATGLPRDPRRRTLHVVVPAGNSHQLRTHFSALLSRCRCSTTMYWQVMPDDETDSFVEIWMPRLDELPTGARLCVTVTPPGLDSHIVAPGNQKFWMGKDEVAGGVIFPRSVPNSRHRTMALVAATATRRRLPPSNGERRLLSPHGTWKIEVALEPVDDSAVQVDAWIQRDDASPGQVPRRGRPSGRQSYFLDLLAPADGTGAVSPARTLNGIGTLRHKRYFVVGAMRDVDGTLSKYSAAGPNADPSAGRIDGPDVVAAADASLNVEGWLAGGLLSSTRLRLSGTSVAAARFSGALADHLAQGKPAETFVSLEPDEPSRESLRMEGEPERAFFILRGEVRRMSLDLIDE